MFELLIANKNYSSWSLRPWVLMRELGIPFREVLVPFGPQPEGQSIAERSPSGKVPCLFHGDTAVWDSLAIVEYLAEFHPGVWPAASPIRAWARSAAAEIHSGFLALRGQCGMNCGVRVAMQGISAALQADLTRLDGLWREGLSRHGGPFLAGAAFTAVDAFFAPVAFRAQSYALELSAEAMAYVRRLLELQSMRDWYAAALEEPWRDAAHEAELELYGRVTDDLRQGP